VEYEGARYHVMCRGNRGGVVFGTEDDVRLFLKTLSDAVKRSGFTVHAYVLMSTHYHLLIETPRGNLVESMKWLQGAFTQRMNAMHQTWGHLFQGRYKAKIIDPDEPEYFRRVSDYIHLNPAVAGLAGGSAAKPLESYAWSSYPFYVKAPSQRPDWLSVGLVLEHQRLPDTLPGRRRYRERMEDRARAVCRDPDGYTESEENKGIERGWVHGSKAFRQQMVDWLEETEGTGRSGVYDAVQKRDLTERSVRKTIEKGCCFFGVKPSGLLRLRKGDEVKVLLAAYIKENYPLENKRISELLSMGHPTFISRCRSLVESDAAQRKAYEKLCRHLTTE
jgi:putative transposase